MYTLTNAIKSSNILSTEGSITELLPQYAELTYRFNAGLSVRISHHGGDKYQATLDGFYTLEPCSAICLVNYLETIN